MIDIDKATEAALKVFPDKDETRMRDYIRRAVNAVRAEKVKPGDFYFHASYGVWVQKINFLDEGTDTVRVFVEVASDDDQGELV